MTTRKGDRAADLPPEVEQQLADMTAADWDVLVARRRAPDQAEGFRTAAAKFVDGARLEAVCAVANLSACVADDGEIDEARVASDNAARLGLRRHAVGY